MQFTTNQTITSNILAALSEDIGSGDISAALIPESTAATAQVITRDTAVICGRAWVEETFRQIDPTTAIVWHVKDGQHVEPNTLIFELSGCARSLLSGERTALNFLQLLSGIATRSRYYADMVAHTSVKLLDTRKTLPGLRIAQKYAVTQGGCHNHRIGLYDAFLIKENHISACGSIMKAVATARKIHPNKPVEVEVEDLEELKQAIISGADRIMLDNFDLEMIHEAVAMSDIELEVSGGITENNLVSIAETGVDLISIGALTKDCKAIDLSMRVS